MGGAGDELRFVKEESMTNLVGADKGNVGQCNGALTSAIRKEPKAVIILDEYEKAHKTFYVTVIAESMRQLRQLDPATAPSGSQ